MHGELSTDARAEEAPEQPAPVVILAGLGRLAQPFASEFVRQGREPVAADGAREAVAVAETRRPSLMLVGTDAGDPYDLIGRLRAAHPEGGILFLTPTTRLDPALGALAAGADDVVAPPHTLSVVALRIELVLGRNGRRAGTRGEGPAAGIVIDRLSRTVHDSEELVHLTRREFELLDRLLEEQGQVVPRGDILADIWGHSQSSQAVLDATVHRLRQKLESEPERPKVLTTVRGIGYRLDLRRVRVIEP